MRLLKGALAAVVAVGAIGISGSAGAVRPGHDIVYLATLPQKGDGSYSPASSGYVGSEGTSANILIQRYQHGVKTATVEYDTISTGSATPGSDYQTTSGTESLGAGASIGEFDVPILQDADQEDPETFNVQISNPQSQSGDSMILSTPSRATVTVLDDDGPARISFAAADYSLFEGQGNLEVLVVRQGDASGSSSVQLATSDGTATSPDDYGTQSVPITFYVGQRTKRISIPIVNDSAGEDAESFTATLSNETGAALTEPDSATIDILDNDSQSSDTTPPVSNFHIPRDGKTYGRRSAVRDQIHISPSDEGSGVADIFVALRKKMRNGTCRWWRGTGFRKSGCGQIKWLDLPYRRTCSDPNRPFCIYQLRNDLKFTTRKTGIKNYTAWAYAEDNAGNIETLLQPGRNESTYFIKP